MQGVGGGVGDDVAGAGQGGADQGVGFILGAGVAGAGRDRSCQGLCGVVGGDADGVLTVTEDADVAVMVGADGSDETKTLSA